MSDTIKIGYFEFAWPIDLSVDLANVVMFALTIVALWFTYSELVKARKRDDELKERHKVEDANAVMLEKRASTKRLYMEYLKLAFDHPDLSSGTFPHGDSVLEDKYDSFVSIMLWTLDEGIGVEEKYYRPTLDWQIGVHEEYIRKNLSKPSIYRDGYSERMLEIIDEDLEILERERNADHLKGAASA